MKKISIRKIVEVSKKSDGKCFYCGGDGYGIDHLTPKSLGGSNDIENLVLCCKSCNSAKGTKTLHEFSLCLSAKDFGIQYIAGITPKFVIPADKVNDEVVNFIKNPKVTEKYNFEKKLSFVSGYEGVTHKTTLS